MAIPIRTARPQLLSSVTRMTNETISVRLSIEEINLILEALG